MYRTAVLWVFLAVVAIVVVDLVLRLVLRRHGPDGAVRRAGSGLFRWLRVAVNVVGFAALFLAASTSLSALLATSEGQLTGDRLMWHVGTAPAFALAAVAITLFWAHRNRFSATDWGRLTSAAWALPLRKLFFWIAVALAIPTLVSILAAMFPLFGTDGQQTLVEIHRYCALPLSAAGLLFAYFALVTWRERSQD